MENTGAQEAMAKSPRRKTRCMFLDEKGRWWLDYYTPDGKRRRKLVGSVTKKEAEKVLRRIKSNIDTGDYVDPAKAPRFSEFCDRFMSEYGHTKKSYVRSTYVIDRMKGFFGNLRLSRLTADHITQYRSVRLGEKSKRNPNEPVSLTTIDSEVGILRAMLGYAVSKGNLAKNPAEQVKDFGQDKKRKRFLSKDEIRSLLCYTKRTDSPILRPAVYLGLQTGMRKAELLNLRWSDIDFEAGQILARETKNGEPRHVPMARGARWLLKKLAAKAPLSEWVFESRNGNGERAPARDIKTAWRRALRLSRIEDFRFHDLRHTFASHYAMRGGNLYALADILGHSNPKITIDRYAHLSPEYVRSQVKFINGMYAAGTGNGFQTGSAAARADAYRS